MATLSSNFFKKSYITEYKNNLKSTFAEKNLTILNLEDLLNYLHTTRLNIAYELRKTDIREKRDIKEREQNMASIIYHLADRMCTDIGREYGKQAVEYTVKASKSEHGGTSKFDILVLIDADYENLNLMSKQSLMDQRFDKIHGFLVTELGECESYPDVHSVNLICSNISGGGAFLMGAYLYCIKRTPTLPQLGLLELAGGYKNTTGLCAYSKFGYIPNLINLGPHCFSDSKNLPMSVNVARLSLDQIFEVVRGNAKVTQFDPSAKEQTVFDILHTHPLCNRSLFKSDEEQKEIALEYNKLYRRMYKIRTLTGFYGDAFNIPNEVMDIIKDELKKKVNYYENKKIKTGKYLTADEKTSVVRDVVDNTLKTNIEILTDLVNDIQETKYMLLDRKIRELKREFERAQDSSKKQTISNTIKGLENIIAAMNRFRGDDVPSPESMRSAETTITEISSRSPSVMSIITDEERSAEEMVQPYSEKVRKIYKKKKTAKKAARKTASKLEYKRALSAKKTSRIRMPPKVPRIQPSPKSVNL